jgi:SAM-dependent methyltransferase
MLDIPVPTGARYHEVGSEVVPACPCCGSGATRILYQVASSIPVHSCVLLDTQADALSFRRGDLELAFCDDCGFAFNHLFDETAMRYSTDFEESQHFSGTFNAFARELAAEIAARCSIASKRVLEIGCGKGEFLAELCRVGNARGLGIDPGFRADAGRDNSDERLEFIVDHFGPRYAHLAADVVLCRHTLEHIAQVGTFTADIYGMVGERADADIVFETPDFKRVLREGAFWDVYYEHCSYFTPGAHARLFRAHGFDVTDLKLVYDDQYIVQYARPAGSTSFRFLPLEDDLEEVRALASDFADRVRVVQRRWIDRISERYAAGQRVVLWGGGSKAVSFLTTLGLTDEVQAAVDINPYKQGKFIPGTGHPVIAPEQLRTAPPDFVVVMNPIYVDEVRRALAALDLFPEVVAV